MKKPIGRQLSRRSFLKLGTQGVLFAAIGGGGLLYGLGRSHPSQADAILKDVSPQPVLLPPRRPSAATVNKRLAATDGFFSLPGRRIFADPATVTDPFAPDSAAGDPDDGVYGFGFVDVPLSVSPSPTEDIGAAILAFKGRVRWPSPILAVNELDDFNITMTNLGFIMRPDLDDAHTIHWHGFRNPNAIFDGVPEVSISVPPARSFTYFYRPRTSGTFMYHCHFEDTEHVQLGMDGVVYVIPDHAIPAGFSGVAYKNDATAFHREYTLLLNEVDTSPHDRLVNIQEFVWSDYDANYWVINGRSYPDTLVSEADTVGTELAERQPVSSLIQALGGDSILLRFVNLGFEQQAMQLLGIRMTVVGQDATPLVPAPDKLDPLSDLSYTTNTIYIGPGESRDVLFTAPAFTTDLPAYTDLDGRTFNIYWLKNHNFHRLVNGAGDRFEDPRLNGDFDDSDVVPPADIYGNPASLGGQVTQVRVYSDLGDLGPQTRANETFGTARLA
jgi:FtsP/CotA-like multicopper oxidase with cupredoxin domain